MKFYTSFHVHKGKILLRGFEDGQKVSYQIPARPYLFVPSKGKGEFRTLEGNPVDRVDFESAHAMREFVKQYEGVRGFKFYGMTNFVYPFINDYYEGEIEYDPSLITTAWIDIEVAADEGFPDVEKAEKEITAITVLVDNIYYCFGCGDYTPHMDNVVYYKCRDEANLLHTFLDTWQSLAPHVVSGWNTEYFDIPYLINRMILIIGADQARKMSPWGLIEEKRVELAFGKRTMQTYMIYGVNSLDYMHLYKKFSFTMQESYKLNHIAHVVLGEKKLDYSEYESLLNLYKENFQLFMEYNIQDTGLVKRMDDKEGIMNQVFALAYDGKVTFNDTLTTVRMWDVIIHNYLYNQGIVVPQFTPSDSEEQIAGGFVKEPKPGLYEWVLSFDLTSLYPHLLMQYNISPETLSRQIDPPLTEAKEAYIDHFINGYSKEWLGRLRAHNECVAASCYTYKKDQQGFIPALMQRIFDDRAKFKKQMIEAKKKFEETGDKKYEAEIARGHNMQMAKKIQLNSCYGALGNPYFRWYDLRLAESVTLSGQLSIRWIEQKLNVLLNRQCGTEGVDYVIAVDTDSVYLNFSAVVEKAGLTDKQEIINYLDKLASGPIQKYIEKSYAELADLMNSHQKMFMKRENICDRAIWTAKKRYICNVWDSEGVRYEKPKLKVMGLEAVRSSVPEVCRNAIKEAYRIILNGTEEEAQSFIADFKEKYYNLPFEAVAFPRGVNGLDKYSDKNNLYKKGTPIHVRGALLFNKALKDYKLDVKYEPIREGDKIRFAYLKMPNPIRENVIACPDALPRQLGLDRFVDYDTQYSKSFMEPISVVLNVIGWTAEKRASLPFDFN